MRGAGARRAVPFVLALVVLAFTLPLAWMGATPLESDCIDTLPGDELAEEETATSLWPPGVRCTSRLPDGREFEDTYVTWYEMSMAFLAAAGVGLFAAALLGVVTLRAFGFGLVAVCAAFLAASSAFFVT
jgi:hypothetical protein